MTSQDTWSHSSEWYSSTGVKWDTIWFLYSCNLLPRRGSALETQWAYLIPTSLSDHGGPSVLSLSIKLSAMDAHGHEIALRFLTGSCCQPQSPQLHFTQQTGRLRKVIFDRFEDLSGNVEDRKWAIGPRAQRAIKETHSEGQELRWTFLKALFLAPLSAVLCFRFKRLKFLRWKIVMIIVLCKAVMS